ncbi:MAG: cobyrinate a,c-diamide synthase [Burkholderiales bacterium]|uniref:cobyrinate a,c-diamide synthase n=1 Tax=Ottowia sp. TaxID=1898956 RepID=UPI001AC805B0|nr:cobyrinate a,c-diamide synthase [Ottowia sp.]MBN9405289.1 cobyrinate a,c-diamide synthase [Burkholderiales bacterium]
MNARCPALLVSAPASGQGKTTVVAALARLLTRRGARVRVFKCGPDFLDPFWHEQASGQPVHNLDLWLTGEADARARLHAAAGAADVILVEGVMGLHDGTPSSADLARVLGLPVLAVVQAGAMAQTLGAIAHGLRHYRSARDGALPWAGVLANGVAGAGHAALLRASLDDPAHWLGALPRSEAMQLPERHLGLVAAHELGEAAALARLDAAADLLAATPLGGMDLADWRARWSVAFEAPLAVAPPAPLLAGRTVAVARDAAFAFVYAANLECLRALGARVVFFSPLAGDALPACDAVWLPGGYPELHAPVLAARTELRAQLHAHAQAGRPVWAECGGMMGLFDELITRDGAAHPMWGLLPGRVRMQDRLMGLGLQSWAPTEAAPALRGHSFHFSACQTALAPLACTTAAPGSARTQGEAVYAKGAVRASYFHAWFASSPSATAALFSNDFGLQPAPNQREQL